VPMMDSNQTRFHLLLGQRDWSKAKRIDGSPIFSPDAQDGEVFSWNSRNELTLSARINVFHSAPGHVPPTLDQRRGAAQDRFGNWYWISDSSDELLVNSSGTGSTTHFWASADESPQARSNAGSFATTEEMAPAAACKFSGLAVTEQHYLVVGILEPAGLVVFDLFHGGSPRQFVWPRNIPFVPFDMAPEPGGGVYILDRMNRRYWIVDRSFAVVRQDQTATPLPQRLEFFVPADGTPPPSRPEQSFPSGLSLNFSSPLDMFDPIAIEAVPDGSVLFLESDSSQRLSRIHRFRFGQELGVPVALDSVLTIVPPEDRPSFTLRGLDFAFIASEPVPEGTRQNTLYIASQNGDQAWPFTVHLTFDQLGLTPIAEYRPMRLFGGKGLVMGQSQVFYDSQDRWIPLVMQKRPRYVESATLITPVFDGKEFNCTWHRLMLDAAFPTDTDIQIFSRAANDGASLAAQNWDAEPKPYKRPSGTELPWTRTPSGLGTWELLFQRTSGQYLQLKLVLSGNGKTTPRIRALRAYYPRFSYLRHYLPGVYREDKESASFVDRFFANTEGFFTSIEDRIATVQALLDASSAPSDALAWLASWFGVALDPAWTEAQRRLFLNNAATFFEARGTVPGLLMALRLTLDDCISQGIFSSPLTDLRGPRIVEKFRTRSVPLGLLRKADTAAGLTVQLQGNMWTPSQGADELDRRYRESLQLAATEVYPLAVSTSDSRYVAWSLFSKQNLGFAPASPDNSGLWTLFLRNRYRVISTLNTAYGALYSQFDDVVFPADLPRQGQPLLDWYQFQGVLLLQPTAHQFTVFLPMPLSDAQNVFAHRSKMSLAQRVIDLEKPAHTEFDIKFYWAFFRLGDTRLGKETVLDKSSRAPQLMLPALLGDTFIGSTYLSHNQPGQPRQRSVLKSGVASNMQRRTCGCQGEEA